MTLLRAGATVGKLEEIRTKIDELDQKMIALFEQRMALAKQVAEEKKKDSLPIANAKREEEVLQKAIGRIEDPSFKPYVASFVNGLFAASKAYQSDLIDASLMVHYPENYPIHIGRGFLKKANQLFPISGKTMIVTDSGIPQEYVDCLLGQFPGASCYVFPMGEANKNLDTLSKILEAMKDAGLDRSSSLLCLGGGVVGDMAGLAASLYMRGIDFYQLPTSLLAMVDSSIGGKTAIDFGGIKNLVGAFSCPKGVLIDPDVLKTLDPRQLKAGLVEAIKMGATSDLSLFELLEGSKDLEEDIFLVIEKALRIKKAVIEQDFKESGLRKVLNFGHTFGHAIEAKANGSLLHGECVGIGMLLTSSGEAKERIGNLLKKYGLPTEVPYSKEELKPYLSLDKKKNGDSITLVTCKKIGSFEFEKASVSDLEAYL